MENRGREVSLGVVDTSLLLKNRRNGKIDEWNETWLSSEVWAKKAEEDPSRHLLCGVKSPSDRARGSPGNMDDFSFPCKA